MARRIIVTGAGGFVGRHLLPLLAEDRVVAIDQSVEAVPPNANLTLIEGDFSQPAVLEQAFAGGCDAVIHLATVPGGAAEQNPELAWQVNVEGTRALAQAAIHAGDCPRFVFASSIAVLGDSLTSPVTDATPLAPRLLYGVHKQMMENWLATLSRRGQLDAISLRLSGVVARPKGPSGMKSAFMSEIFHALAAGENYCLPVSSKATCWMITVKSAVQNLVHALDLDSRYFPSDRAVTLPALRVRMDELVSAIARFYGRAPSLVDFQVDPDIEAAFGAYPALITAQSDALKFRAETSVNELVENAAAGVKRD